MEPDAVPVACTLAPSARPDRLEAWRSLRPDLRGSRLDGGRLEADFAPRAAADLLRLVEAERSCCAWATWAVTDSTLSIEGPEDAVAALAVALLGEPR